jgi:hypothetical protein
MTHDPNVMMQQWIAAGTELVRAAFVDGVDETTRGRAARVCRVLLQMLEPAAPSFDGADVPQYQPRPPATFAEYVAHLMQNPQELLALLGPALGPAAPAGLAMLRNAFLRPAPAYR